MTPNLGFKIMVLFMGNYQSSAFYVVQLQIIRLLNLQCNVPLMCGPSAIAEYLVKSSSVSVVMLQMLTQQKTACDAMLDEKNKLITDYQSVSTHNSLHGL